MTDSDSKPRFLFADRIGPECTLDLLRTERDHRLAHVGDPDWTDFLTSEAGDGATEEANADSPVDAWWPTRPI